MAWEEKENALSEARRRRSQLQLDAAAISKRIQYGERDANGMGCSGTAYV